jgi:hypothetical protein
MIARGDEGRGHPVHATPYVEPVPLQVRADPRGRVLLGEGELGMRVDVAGKADQAFLLFVDRCLSPLFERRADVLWCHGATAATSPAPEYIQAATARLAAAVQVDHLQT